MACIQAKEKKQDGKQSLWMAQLEVEKLHLQLQIQASSSSQGVMQGPEPTSNFPQTPMYFEGNGLGLDLNFQHMHKNP